MAGLFHYKYHRPILMSISGSSMLPSYVRGPAKTTKIVRGPIDNLPSRQCRRLIMREENGMKRREEEKERKKFKKREVSVYIVEF